MDNDPLSVICDANMTFSHLFYFRFVRFHVQIFGN